MATMMTFCLAAMLYPFYEQAQRELDTVIGRDLFQSCWQQGGFGVVSSGILI